MISKSERDDLARIVRMRAKVARDGIVAREAELVADVEEQLSAVYRFDEDVWAEITRQAKAAVTQADARIATICRELGVPERFRPKLMLQWYNRGETAIAERRNELRKLAKARIAAAGQAAKLEISRCEVEVQTELYVARLESGEATAFLQRLPTVEQLMPQFSIGELGADTRPVPAPASGDALARAQRVPLTRSAVNRAAIAAALMEGPNLSDRAVARRIGTSPTTVGTIRAELSNTSAQPSNLDSEA